MSAAHPTKFGHVEPTVMEIKSQELIASINVPKKEPIIDHGRIKFNNKQENN